MTKYAELRMIQSLASEYEYESGYDRTPDDEATLSLRYEWGKETADAFESALSLARRIK